MSEREIDRAAKQFAALVIDSLDEAETRRVLRTEIELAQVELDARDAGYAPGEIWAVALGKIALGQAEEETLPMKVHWAVWETDVSPKGKRRRSWRPLCGAPRMGTMCTDSGGRVNCKECLALQPRG